MIAEKYSRLPVAEIAGAVNESLAAVPRLVVTAPPGAGKSTLLPLTMLEALPEGRIMMLEPRRLAARQVASRMASMLGETVGRTVGYRVRFETRVSEATRIEVITEGILERMLVDDPTLDGVAAVIFDEFHERSIASDTVLALTLEAQNVIRPDLRIVIMSATIDAAPLCRAIGARHLHSEGRMHDVGIIYGDDFRPSECSATVVRAVRRAWREQKGDILAFLPGQGEIMRCAELLAESLADADILPLYGMLPPEKQRLVLAPAPSGRRRIVLATPIAETSLTIEGIGTVVDSGLCRTMVFDPSSGLSRLATVPVSLDMATQRAGRAGRGAPYPGRPGGSGKPAIQLPARKAADRGAEPRRTAGPAGSHRGADRLRQNHPYQPPDAVLRPAGRRGAGGRNRHPQRHPREPAGRVRHGAAGDLA